jgi:isopentenyl-diphosphate delta-isomerase
VSSSGEPRHIIEDRKRQQLHLALAEASQSDVSPRWEDVHLVPSSIPEVSQDHVSLAADFLGHRLAAPIVITGMTGGHPDAVVINQRLGELAEEFQIAVGVGSQRAALVDEGLRESYSVVRKAAPRALVIANIGVSQLVQQEGADPLGVDDLRRVVDMVEAQVLAIHLNVLEELVQPEGDRNTSGHLAAIAQTIEIVDVPVMVKETGVGMDQATAASLAALGVAAIDVGGLGGTNFARVEAQRAADAGDVRRARLGATFADWGIPTGASILEVRDAGVPVIATGGVRSGLDMAKALALGADLVGLGRPMLMAAVEGAAQLEDTATAFLDELGTAMVLTGSASLSSLRETPVVLTGLLRDWSAALERR